MHMQRGKVRLAVVHLPVFEAAFASVLRQLFIGRITQESTVAHLMGVKEDMESCDVLSIMKCSLEARVLNV